MKLQNVDIQSKPVCNVCSNESRIVISFGEGKTIQKSLSFCSDCFRSLNEAVDNVNGTMMQCCYCDEYFYEDDDNCDGVCAACNEEFEVFK